MNLQIILNGIGGQGVIFLSEIITKVALKRNYKIKVAETLGMARRGGSVISFLKIGDYHSPMVIPKDGDILICLHENELENGRYYIKSNGKIFVNSDSFFNATKIALKHNNPKMTNVIFLGYIAKDKDFPFSYEDILEVLPVRAKEFFKIGYES